ncbi:MAG: hypothetical protein Q4D15_09585, partial [Lachnospiraceae bacterium]|nr:hypothetical protein [Lachnospiraceae bacterium]
SFVLPIQAFLSAGFWEVDVIDPRYYKEDIAEYCRTQRPDMVIMMINTLRVTEKDFLKQVKLPKN